MSLHFKKSGIIIACFLFVIIGCTKKTTKVESLPSKSTENVVKTQTPVKDDSFEVAEKTDDVFATIYFDYDKYDLKQEAIDRLAKIASYLSNNKEVRVLVEGHADERGTDEYNIGLGENRSKAVKNYLVNYGLSKKRFEVVSYGKASPVDPNCGEDEYCHSRNRRVEWKVLAK